MKPIVVLGTIFVHLALIAYGVGIINEQIKHKITRFVLIFLGLGLFFDVVATVCMIIGSGRGFITTHGLLGYSCLLLMAIDALKPGCRVSTIGETVVPEAHRRGFTVLN